LADKKIAVVTGANGLIGMKLCQTLKEHDWYVIAVCRQPISGPWDRAVAADLAKDGEIPLPSDISVVFHLAGKAHALAETAQEEAEYFSVNTEGTRRMLEAAQRAKVRRFVMFSSVKAMGEGGIAEQDETTECQPMSPYGKSKLAAENLVLEGGYVSEPVVLRLSMVYGLPNKGNLPRMIEAVSKNRFPPLPDVGNRRSMVHVEDVVQAAFLAAERLEAVGQTYIVTDGRQYSTRQIYLWICHALQKPIPRWVMPLPPLRLLAFIGDGIGHLCRKRFVFDTDALDKLIGSAAYSCKKLQSQLAYRPLHDLQRTLQGYELTASQKHIKRQNCMGRF
jgi:UDP-glucose 4-epimerase